MGARLEVRNVGLVVPNYVQRGGEARSWTSTIARSTTARLAKENRQLLIDISFSLGPGDRLALLGRNGAGKTTLLRVLAGSLEPSSGSINVEGSLQALLNLGLGFNAEATLTENVFLRATAMGLRSAQIRRIIGPALEFAELAHVANHRLATLSSGQRMRLGFAVSTAVQHDIMLLDEWFGAGDASFVQRARARMGDRVAGSQIIVLASHNFQMLRQVCNRGLVLEGGTVHFYGPVDEAIAAYKSTYQSSEEYQAGRRLLEEEAERMVRSEVKALKRQSQEQLRAQLRQINEQKAKLKADREEVRRIRERLMARLERSGSSPKAGRDGAD